MEIELQSYFCPTLCERLALKHLVQLFLLKFMCPNPDCFGTLAPLVIPPGAEPPTNPAENVYECNVCGGRRTEAQFLADLEQPAAGHEH